MKGRGRVRGLANNSVRTSSAGVLHDGAPSERVNGRSQPRGRRRDAGDGRRTATIAGTPAAGTGGTYHLTIAAANGFGTAIEDLIVTVDEAPTFVSGSSTAFGPRTFGTFTVRTSGYPAASIKESGPLPKGVSFKTGGNGTATISGTPTTTKSTVYRLRLTATNGVGCSATQTFTLTVG